MTALWKPFAPRSIVPRGVRELAGWQLKIYEVNAAPAGVDWNDLTDGLALAGAALPQPPVAKGRAGLGFLIIHPNVAFYYIILNWWDNENELFSRAFVTKRPPGAGWIAGADQHSFCVWDMEVMSFEREQWIATMLSGGANGAAYLMRQHSRAA